MAGCCEYGNELMGSFKFEKVVIYTRDSPSKGGPFPLNLVNALIIIILTAIESSYKNACCDPPGETDNECINRKFIFLLNSYNKTK